MFLYLDGFIFTAAALPEGLAVQLERTSDFRLEIQIIVQAVGFQASLYHLHNLGVSVDQPESVGVPADEGTVVVRLNVHGCVRLEPCCCSHFSYQLCGCAVSSQPLQPPAPGGAGGTGGDSQGSTAPVSQIFSGDFQATGTRSG